MPKLILFKLDSASIIVVDFQHYCRTEKELKSKLESYKIYPLYMSTYYYPPKETTEARFSIAVEHVYFLKFLKKLSQIFQDNSRI